VLAGQAQYRQTGYQSALMKKAHSTTFAALLMIYLNNIKLWLNGDSPVNTCIALTNPLITTKQNTHRSKSVEFNLGLLSFFS
jgi:hypothetical protein